LKNRNVIFIVLVSLVVLGLTFSLLTEKPDRFTVNKTSLILIKGLFHSPDLLVEVKPTLASQASKNCDANWKFFIVLDRTGEQTGKLAAWRKMLDCPRSYLGLLIVTSLDNVELTREIVERYPDEPDALFSLAEQIYRDNPTEASQLYTKELAQKPLHGLSWCRLGIIYKGEKQYQKAADAYLNCCKYGYSDKKICLGAGQMMEKTGNLARAIEYYRWSTLEQSTQRINELEKQIQP
jgi:tetratricopeptide (TPR) repeat protein